MGWCLNCHRNPDPHIRDPKLVTDLAWGVTLSDIQKREMSALYKLAFANQTTVNATDREVIGRYWRDRNHLNPSQDCSTCHR
jgi:hypothetical protein